MHRAARTLLMIAVLGIALLPRPVRAAELGIHAQIDALVMEKDFSAAEKKAERYLQEHPGDTEAMCALACVYRNRSRQSAVNVNTDAMGIKEGESGQYQFKDADDVKNLFSEQIYFDADDHARAEALYYKIIAADPTYQNAYFNLLNDYVVTEEFDRYFQVIDLYVKNLKGNESADYNLNDLAGKLFREEYYDQALQLFAIIVKNFPDDHEARSDMGAVYSQQGKFDQAREVFREVYERVPGDEVNLGNYYFTSVLAEDFATARRLTAKMARMAGKENRLFDLALLDLVLQRDPGPGIEAYLKVRKGQVDDVEKDFWYQAAMELGRLNQMPRDEQLAFLESLLNQFNQADYPALTIIVANLVEQIEPTNFVLVVHTSVFDKHQYLKKTIEYLDRISQRRATDPTIMSEYNLNWNYGRNYYVAGQYAEAKGYLLKNAQAQPDDAMINYYLGKCYLALQQKEEAVKLFRKNSKMDDKEQMTFINSSIRELEKL